jgi:hypothetical protein
MHFFTSNSQKQKYIKKKEEGGQGKQTVCYNDCNPKSIIEPRSTT